MKTKTMRLVWCALVALMFGVAGREAAAAQDVPAPVTPDPADCLVAEGRSIEEVIAIFDGAATPEAAHPAEVMVPTGRAADAATVAAVTATVHEMMACTNGGDVGRLLAFFTPAGIVAAFPWLGESLVAEDGMDGYFLEPTPVPVADRETVLAVADVTRLADGRVGAFVVHVDPTAGRDGPEVLYLILTRQGPRWQVDDFRFFTEE